MGSPLSMIKLASEADQVCVAKANEAGQKHIFDGWDDLPSKSQQGLIQQIQSIDFQLTSHLIHQCFREHSFRSLCERKDDVILRSPEIAHLPAPGDPEHDRLVKLGEDALRSGKVALVLTGDSARRSREGEPTGLLPIGPVTGNTIFQLFAERVRAMQRRYKCSIPWFIVTHSATHQVVEEAFRKNAHYGLQAADTIFLPQPVLPLVDRRGRFVLSEPGELALEPNGHGGVLVEFLKTERLEELRSRGVEHVFFFQVDNPLVQIADPLFIGHHIAAGAEISSKAIEKKNKDENLGVFAQMGQTTTVIEYTELEEADRTRQNDDGTLALGYGNMSVHAISVDFFDRMREENVSLPFHTRKLAVSCVGRRGRRDRPTEPNCIQFRFFLFDALSVANRANIVAADRDVEYAPIKNAAGDMSPQTAQCALARLWASWLRDAGATFKNSTAGDGLLAVEISPLYALDGRELKSKLQLPLEVDQDLLLGGSAK
ncbi:MAG: UTP--glucose-1-phosphate uridylyltransferase [Planctomycetota bacterium]